MHKVALYPLAREEAVGRRGSRRRSRARKSRRGNAPAYQGLRHRRLGQSPRLRRVVLARLQARQATQDNYQQHRDVAHFPDGAPPRHHAYRLDGRAARARKRRKGQVPRACKRQRCEAGPEGRLRRRRLGSVFLWSHRIPAPCHASGRRKCQGTGMVHGRGEERAHRQGR